MPNDNISQPDQFHGRRAALSSILPLLVWSLMILRMVAFGQAPSAATAKVYFNVVDVFGNTLPYQVASFAIASSSRDYATRFKLLRGESIPYGEYSYKLRRSDFPDVGEVSGVMTVNRSEVLKTVVYHGVFTVIQGRPTEGLQAMPRGFVIRGVVRPRPVTENLVLVRIQSVYDATTYEARLDENGEFRVEELLRGNYVVLVVDGAKVLYCGSVTFRPISSKPGSLTIDASTAVPKAVFSQ